MKQKADSIRVREIRGVRWEYLLQGHGERTLVLFPGIVGGLDTMDRHIERFSRDFQVLAVTIPPLNHVDAFTLGMNALLDAEGLDKVTVMGGSFGGFLAQAYFAAYPDRVDALVLSDTDIPNRDRAWSNSIARNIMSVLPFFVSRALFCAKMKALFKHAPAEFEDQLAQRVTRMLHWIKHKLTRRMLLDRLDLALSFDTSVSFDREMLGLWPGRMLITYALDDPSRENAVPMENVFTEASIHSFKDGGHLTQLIYFDQYAELVLDFLQNKTAPTG